jgi:hypothetical protein
MYLDSKIRFFTFTMTKSVLSESGIINLLTSK